MTAWFVTRHPGASDWAKTQSIAHDVHVMHLDPAVIEPGDVVIGSLPVHLAAAVCARGGRYLNLSLDLLAHLRGRELDAETLSGINARLEEYIVTRKENRSCA